MPVLGITGSIATGKSTFTRSLLGRLPAESFDADRTSHSLLTHDPGVRVAVEEAFGAEIYDREGHPDRARLRDLVFSDEQNRLQLEKILHPAIRARWIARSERARGEKSWFVVDIPLLYETGAEAQCNLVVVVACSLITQRRRLANERGMDADTATRIIAAQIDLNTKITKADHLIWNDSTVSCLDGQAELLASRLKQSYG